MNRLLVIIPTYNERENLASIVARTLASVPTADILVVDDNSPDGTAALAHSLAVDDPRVHVLDREGKDGLGAAYRAGFAWGLPRDYERFVEMDADGSHQPEQLPDLIAAMDAGADVVLGSRWVAGGSVENWPLSRQLLSIGGSIYARTLLRLRARDVTGGFRVYTAAALSAIDLSSVTSAGYGFQIEMLWHAHHAGLRVVEVPIRFVERVNGVSKMSRSTILEAFVRVAVWAMSSPPSSRRRSQAEPKHTAHV